MDFKFAPNAEAFGIDPEVAAAIDGSEAVATALKSAFDEQSKAVIDTAVTNRTAVSLDEFKTKMNGLGEKLTAAEQRAKTAEERVAAMPAIEPEKLEELKALAAKNPELQGMLDAATAKNTETAKTLADREAEITRQGEALLATEQTMKIAAAMDEHDRANAAVAVRPDSRDLVAMLAKDVLRRAEDGKTWRVHNADGSVMATDQGAASMTDWMTKLRAERPSLFLQPTGGGAPGQKSPGGAAGKQSISRGEFNALSPLEQAKTARTHTISD